MSKRRRQQDIGQQSEEAKEEQEHVEDDDGREISQGEGEDLMENQEQDYRNIQALDRYENQGVDQEHIEENPEARIAAEKEMQKRDQQKNAEDVEEYFEEDEDYSMRMQERRRILYADQEEEQVDERRFLDAEDVKGRLPQWIKQVETLKYIKSKFSKFLTQYKGEVDFPIYVNKIRDMCTNNLQTIQISYNQLKEALPLIAMWVAMQPALIMPQLNTIAYNIACRNYASYKNIHPQVFVRIKQLPIVDSIRDLRYTHLGKMVKIKGVITVRTEVFSQLRKVIYKCIKCGYLKGPFYKNSVNDISLGQCSSCQSNGPFKIDKAKTIYRNYQKMTVQESPSDVLPGRIPRSKEVIVLGDMIDKARPGDEIDLTGIFLNRCEFSLNIKNGFPLFSTYIEANYMCKQMEQQHENLHLQQQKYINFSKTKGVSQIIYNTIAPSIYGHYNVKRSLTLSLFGGVEKEPKPGHKIRGDINVLLLGDPSTAKSQFLKSIQKIATRSVYTTGKGASAVGLTASVKKDFSTNEWKLEAGALVLADKGICLIDQFDKMNEQDRTSIHQAMEQQSISISKAGIVTSLRARCAIIAAANPIQGRYNSQLSFNQNVELTEPILSRFDILNVIKDEVNDSIDHHLSTFVINSHMFNHPYLEKYDLQPRELPQTLPFKPSEQTSFIKGYIKYAREKCKPVLPDKNLQIIKQFYLHLREESKNTGGIKVGTRHIESIIRIATAHAKMHLQNQIQKADIDIGVQTMLESFIQTQKHSVAKVIRRKFHSYFE